MARLNTNAEIFDSFSEFGRMIDSTAASTLNSVTSTAAADATSLTVANSTTLSTGSYIRVGPQGGSQVAYVTAISTADVLTLRTGLAEAVSTGEAVRLLARAEIGCPDDNGVQVDINTDITTINSACQRNAYAHLVAHTDAQSSVGLLNISWENLMATVGTAESELLGADTAANPKAAYWLPDNFDTVKPLHFYARGTLKDGTVYEAQFWDCDIDPAKSMALGRGLESPLGLVFFQRVTAWFKPA